MAKVSKKTKAKKKDFQKVKLKLGKKLPKSQNDTTTSFKSRAIQLKDQLKQSKDEPQTHRKQNITELLGQLQHYSPTVRLAALTGLKQLLTDHPQLIRANLSTLLDRTAESFVDRDPAVRRAAAARCAMSHVDAAVRADSLAPLDVYLEFLPRTLAAASPRILRDFLELISRRRDEKDGGVAGSRRALTVDPASRLSTQRWRVSVLRRMSVFLRAYHGKEATTATERGRERGGDGGSRAMFLYGGAHAFTAESSTCKLRDVRNHKHRNAVSDAKEASLDGPMQLTAFVDTLMPLLLDLWVESKSKQSGEHLPESVLSEEAATVVEMIFEVILLLLQYIERASRDSDEISVTWLEEKYEKELTQHFFTNFPYTLTDTPVGTGKKSKVRPNRVQKVRALNVNIAVATALATILGRVERPSVEQQDLLRKAEQYAAEVVEATGTRTATDLREMLALVAKLLAARSTRNGGFVGEASEAAYKAFACCHPSSAQKQRLLEMFCNVALETPPGGSITSLDHWLSALPVTLVQLDLSQCGSVSSVLALMHRAASQQRAAFLTSLQKQLTTILGMLPGMSHEQQKTTLQLLYFAKTLRKTHFHVLVNWVRSEATDMTLVKYLLSLLNGRLAKQLTSGEVWTEPSAYISYTISLLVGGSVPKMAEQQFPTMPLLSPHVYAPEIDGGSLDGWPRQKDVVLAVHDSIRLLPNSQQVEDLYLGHVEQILSDLSL
ncbi:PREDICTED: testis-expressed sequence 10 protein homolog [Priapulus caudatus]|uniref:Testis-expressed sequence 10 protein homolog n=1 Tax=Priapulus caudatus TaxID=37621 RepID=A0ABM1E1Z3_PRICU|nr:PREDICTED: testis-expressed sequence 10 protein homolog [Priapulus caudatus]